MIERRKSGGDTVKFSWMVTLVCGEINAVPSTTNAPENTTGVVPFKVIGIPITITRVSDEK